MAIWDAIWDAGSDAIDWISGAGSDAADMLSSSTAQTQYKGNFAPQRYNPAQGSGPFYGEGAYEKAGTRTRSAADSEIAYGDRFVERGDKSRELATGRMTAAGAMGDQAYREVERSRGRDPSRYVEGATHQYGKAVDSLNAAGRPREFSLGSLSAIDSDASRIEGVGLEQRNAGVDQLAAGNAAGADYVGDRGLALGALGTSQAQGATAADQASSRYGTMSNALNTLEGAANGTAPSAAQAQLASGLQQSLDAQMAAAKSGRSPGAMLAAARAGQQQMARAANDAAALRANEMAQARGQLAGAAASEAARTAGLAQSYAGQNMSAAQGLAGMSSGRQLDLTRAGLGALEGAAGSYAAGGQMRNAAGQLGLDIAQNYQGDAASRLAIGNAYQGQGEFQRGLSQDDLARAQTLLTQRGQDLGAAGMYLDDARGMYGVSDNARGRAQGYSGQSNELLNAQTGMFRDLGALTLNEIQDANALGAGLQDSENTFNLSRDQGNIGTKDRAKETQRGFWGSVLEGGANILTSGGYGAAKAGIKAVK